MKQISPCALYLQRLAPSGRRSMKSQLNMVRQYMKWSEPIETQPFHELKYAELEAIKQHFKEQGKAPRTINLCIHALKGIIKTAFLNGEIAESQWLKIQGVKLIKTTENLNAKALSAANVFTMINECASSAHVLDIRDAAILAVFLSTGLRRFEIANLNLSDFKLDPPSFIVNKGKGNKAREQYLPLWVLPYLTQWLQLRGNENGSYFCPLNGKQFSTCKVLSETTLYRLVVKRSSTLLGFKITPHDLRRTFITELLRQEVDLSTVSKMAGHASVATTQLYDKRDSSVMQAAITKLNYQFT
jgi:site-specific recombinase XerC